MAGQTNFAIIFQSPSRLTVKCLSKVDKSNLEVHRLFLAFFLKLSCCEDHVSCSSILPESTLAFW